MTITRSPAPQDRSLSGAEQPSRGVGQSLVPLAVCLALCGAILAWLAISSARPYSDSGGYESMLRHFLDVGRVDYMKWSQPTFIGLLPAAVPWAGAFGTSTASLQWLSVFFALALIGGVWAFCKSTVGAWPAFWMALGVLLLHDALASSVSFMTDVPYAAYLVGFLLAHRALEARHVARHLPGYLSSHAAFEHGEEDAPPIVLWLAWGALFLLSALTRSFSLALVPVFFMQWLRARGTPGLGAFSLRCLIGGGALAVLSVVLTRRLGLNNFTPGEITAIPLILQGEMGRLNVRSLFAGVLGLAVAILPSLLMWSAAQQSRLKARFVGSKGAPLTWRGVSIWDAMLGAVALGLGLLLWRKGNLNSVVALPQSESLQSLLNILQVVLGVIALPLAVRVLVRGVQSARELRPRAFQAMGDEAPSALPHTSGVLCAVALAHFALMPILLHPLARHLMPAGIAVLLLIALQSTSSSTSSTSSAPRDAQPVTNTGLARAQAGLSGAMTLLLLIGVVLGVAASRALNQSQFDAATALNRSGVPLPQIAGGWSFFCARDLNPGLRPTAYLPPNDYVARFSRLEERAPFLVTTDNATRGRLLSSSRVPLAGARTVRVLQRAVASKGTSTGTRR